ncbi:hypothetical protein NMY22_g13867 [Coprinellus aureogranulatus]|nr:hypothetical protein NMY22_g13867 [Coprinellus aureogranulatus]
MPPKRKSEEFTSKIPWEDVDANTLRTVCREIGGSSTVRLNKQGMISFLGDVERFGVETALENVSNSDEPPKSSKTPKPAKSTPFTTSRTRTTSLKRKKPEPEPADEQEDEGDENEEDDGLQLQHSS